MEYFVPIESNHFRYRMFQITSFGIGIGFLSAGLSYMFNSGVSINEEVQKQT